MALRIQNCWRSKASRDAVKSKREDMEKMVLMQKGALRIQTQIRAFLARARVRTILEGETRELVLGSHATFIQKMFRGRSGRKRVMAIRRNLASRFIQRVFRGHVGRAAAARERHRLEALRKRAFAATKVQATWKMMVAREEYRLMRVHMVAAVECQRTYRGHLGRKKAARRREWENAEPGPERLKLGLKLIEESKVAFERQQEEIDALHRSQEKAESRVSHIHVELREAEKELSVLERELQEIDQIERDLHELTHERELLQLGITGAAGIGATGDPNGGADAGAAARQIQAESYALEIAIHRKRAEREKRRQELDAEFAAVFQDVQRKKQALNRLEVSQPINQSINQSINQPTTSFAIILTTPTNYFI